MFVLLTYQQQYPSCGYYMIGEMQFSLPSKHPGIFLVFVIIHPLKVIERYLGSKLKTGMLGFCSEKRPPILSLQVLWLLILERKANHICIIFSAGEASLQYRGTVQEGKEFSCWLCKNESVVLYIALQRNKEFFFVFDCLFVHFFDFNSLFVFPYYPCPYSKTFLDIMSSVRQWEIRKH